LWGIEVENPNFGYNLRVRFPFNADHPLGYVLDEAFGSYPLENM
jgi:hypothetical protein